MEQIWQFFGQFDFIEVFSSFIVMFAIIDILGSIPIFLSLKEGGKPIKAMQACLTALGLFLAFFFAGDALLKLFGIDKALTALLSLRAEYAVLNIIIGLLLNLALDYLVIRLLDKVKNLLGANLIFIIRKFFGVILLAIAVNMFVNNIYVIIANVPTIN